LTRTTHTTPSVVALMAVPPDMTDHYGIATIEDIGEGDVVRIVDLVEKPDPKDAPSNFAVIGRYMLRCDSTESFENTEPGKGNEIQLTDALPDGNEQHRRRSLRDLFFVATGMTRETNSTTSRPLFDSRSSVPTSDRHSRSGSTTKRTAVRDFRPVSQSRGRSRPFDSRP